MKAIFWMHFNCNWQKVSKNMFPIRFEAWRRPMYIAINVSHLEYMMKMKW